MRAWTRVNEHVVDAAAIKFIDFTLGCFGDRFLLLFTFLHSSTQRHISLVLPTRIPLQHQFEAADTFHIDGRSTATSFWSC